MQVGLNKLEEEVEGRRAGSGLYWAEHRKFHLCKRLLIPLVQLIFFVDLTTTRPSGSPFASNVTPFICFGMFPSSDPVLGEPRWTSLIPLLMLLKVAKHPWLFLATDGVQLTILRPTFPFGGSCFCRPLVWCGFLRMCACSVPLDKGWPLWRAATGWFCEGDGLMLLRAESQHCATQLPAALSPAGILSCCVWWGSVLWLWGHTKEGKCLLPLSSLSTC